MKTVVLTRPQGKNQALATALTAQGIRALELPALTIRPVLTVLAQDHLPGPYDLLLFVSAQAATFYLDLLASAGVSFTKGQCIATVGAASAQPFYEAGLDAVVELIHPPAQHPYQDSEALWQLLQPRLHQFHRVLLVRGQQGREWLSEQLESAGKQLTRCAIYERVPATWSGPASEQLAQALQQPQDVVSLLSSSESTQAIYTNVVRLGLESSWLQSRFVAIHPRIVQCLQDLTHWSPEQVARQVRLCAPSQPAMLDVLLSVAMPK